MSQKSLGDTALLGGSSYGVEGHSIRWTTMQMQTYLESPKTSLSQWLNFKLSGITCLVGKKSLNFLSQGPLAE